MTAGQFLEHTALALAYAAAGILLGGLFGLGIGRAVRAACIRLPRAIGLLPLAPWRTLEVALLTLAVAAPLHLFRLRLPFTDPTGFEAVLVSLILAATATAGVILDRSFPTSMGLRVLAGARSIAVASPAITAGLAWFWGWSDLGILLQQSIMLLRMQLARDLWLAMLGCVLLIDMGFGVLQTWLAAQKAVRAERPDSSMGAA
jgi:hypothetical protein